MGGGRAALRLRQSARARRRKLTMAEYAQIGQWTNQQLKKRNVWAVLMPLHPKTVEFVKAIQSSPDWQLVFFNNKQKLFVDGTTPQAQELFRGILDGKTLYPDDFSRNLVIAHNLLLPGRGEAEYKRGLDFAIEAFKLNPSQAPMHKIMSAARFAELRPRVYNFCKAYFDEFTKNKNVYAKRDGYYHTIWTARVAGEHLRKIAKMRKDTELVQFYDAKIKEYRNEENQLNEGKWW